MPTRLSPRWFNQPKYLRQIFNSVWLQLQQEGKADPRDAAMRKEVAMRVWAFGKPEVLDPDNIKHAVLRSLIRRSHKKQAGD
jgi:TfoX/Sxy family transcriptional regulator of competence genes